jgi:Flagellar assembly protein T, C-terminal domain
MRRLNVFGVVVALSAATALTTGCNTIRNVIGYPSAGDPTVELKRAESKWLLIKNPRFGDVPSEPEYVWVEEEKMPTTLKSLVFGKSTLLAPPEVVSKYGHPPGGGRISPLQKVPYQTAAPAPAPDAARAPRASVSATPTTRTDSAPVPVAATPPPSRGYVVFVDTTRIVIDLTARDGVKPGSLVSLRRDKIPIVHPMTGELLGELDEEVATGKVTEVREKFSVVEVQSASEAAEIKIRDRVLLR